MNKLFLICCIFTFFLGITAAIVQADIVILKNGQTLKGVTIKDEGDTLYCENKDQSFYINNTLKQLDMDEKSVLREFYIQQANTLEMPVEDIVVSGLIKKGILDTTREKGPYSAGGLMLPVIISPVAKKHIKPVKIDMPSNIDDPETRETLSKSRPQYMYEMAGFYQSL